MKRFVVWGEPARPASPRSALDSQQVTGTAGVQAAPRCDKATSLLQIPRHGAAQLLQMWQEHRERERQVDMGGHFISPLA